LSYPVHKSTDRQTSTGVTLPPSTRCEGKKAKHRNVNLPTIASVSNFSAMPRIICKQVDRGFMAVRRHLIIYLCIIMPDLKRTNRNKD